jgi:hypothetical protein
MGTEGVHEVSTRAARRRRQRSASSAAVLAAVLLLGTAIAALAPGLAHSASQHEFEVSRAPEAFVPDTGIVHDVAIEIVAPGSEGLELSTRLTDEGGIIERPVSWTIRTATGEKVFAGDVPVAHIATEPGDYIVEAQYGTVRFERTVTLLAGNRLIVSFVLNVGGIRVLPRFQGLGLPQAPSRTLIYATSGKRKGELVAKSDMPGEILRVAAGDYLIESRFAAGNAVAVAAIHVKPGIMSAVEIDHAAGLARLAFAGAADTAVSWSVSDDSGQTLPQLDGTAAEIVLKPGTYRATATVNGQILTATFAIAAGETRDIILGN